MRSKANREKSKWKHWHRTGFFKKDIKFYGFVYRLHNGCLKDHEMEGLKYTLREEDNWQKYCYDPLVYITQKDIDRHFKNTLWEKDDYPFNCIEVWVSDPLSSPYAGHGAIRHNAWVIKKPGYYRVSVTFQQIGESNTFRTIYKMKHYKGMPYFNRRNERCYNNHVSRAYHTVLDHCRDIKKQIFAEREAIEDRKRDTYYRLKYWRDIKNELALKEKKERLKRVRGIVPTKATTAFFQALAVGSAISEA
jgi:hypothetical protein